MTAFVRTLVIAALVSSMAFATGCSQQQQTPSAPSEGTEQAPSQEGSGTGGAQGSTEDPSALAQEKCTQCHTYDRVENATKDRAQWEQTVNRMIQNGCKLTDDEKATIIDYLASK